MSFTVELPKDKSSIIKVVGVGGGGGNAVNHMYREGINGVDFFICNTDAQALENSPIPNKIQIGNALTEGRGAGSNPEVGRKAAEENIQEIIESLGVNTQMVFVTAGMSLLVISNDRIKEIYGNLAISKAFGYADNVLTTAAKGIAEIITIAGSINVDFEDVKTAMRDSGVSIMGMGTSEGDDRAMRAVNQALNSPLLDDNRIQGASDLLVNISYGEEEATMDEYAQINEFLQGEAGSAATLKCGLCYDSSLGRGISVTVIATGFNRAENRYKVNFETTDEVEFNLGDINVNEEMTAEERDAQKQTTIFDELEGFEEDATAAANRKIEQMKQRAKYLRELNETANKENGMEELENVPAYKRKNITLDEVTHSSESDISRTSLIEEPNKKPELRTNNSFLHDNVD